MANRSLAEYGTRATPQRQRIPGRTDQVSNSEGGFVFAVDKWTRLNRWLILGSEGGSYYATEQKLTFHNLDAVMECIGEDGPRAVSIIVSVSDEGRAPKNDQALFALALCSAHGDDKTRMAAYEALPQVARTATHLFQFITYRKQFANWSAGLRRAVGRWYTEQDPGKLALQLVKYRSRAVEGSKPYTHRDVLRLCHVDAKGHAKTDNPHTRGLLGWAAGKGVGGEYIMSSSAETLAAFHIIEGFEKVQRATTPAEVARLITEYRLPRECIPTTLLNSREVYEALLPHMGLTALIRNLATMTRLGLLDNMSQATSVVIDKLSNTEALLKSRIHPITLLFALKTYQSGRSVKGSSTWNAVPRIVDALDDAFYASFGNVPATGKRRCIALDVSGSMSGSSWSGGYGFEDIVPGLSPRVAAAAMAMVTMKTGDPYEILAFTADSQSYGRAYGHYDSLPQIYPGVSLLSFSPRQRIDDICKATENIFPGGTDCSLPMLYAATEERTFDVFEVYTDSETFAGHMHASQALQRYREASGINAKLVVYGMVSNGFTIADPKDPGMLDVVGFDTATPAIVDSFVNGEL